MGYLDISSSGSPVGFHRVEDRQAVYPGIDGIKFKFSPPVGKFVLSRSGDKTITRCLSHGPGCLSGSYGAILVLSFFIGIYQLIPSV